MRTVIAFALLVSAACGPRTGADEPESCPELINCEPPVDDDSICADSSRLARLQARCPDLEIAE